MADEDKPTANEGAGSDQQAEPRQDNSDAPSIDQLDNLLPIDDFEEEVVEGDKTVRQKGVYLLPNLFTTAALFSGFFAVVSAMNNRFEAAAIAMFIGMLLDMFDGRIARLTNTQSKFGAEYDSLSDMVTFGVAPALAVFSWALSDLGKVGWAAAFIYVASAALRLARFNTQIDTADKNYFTGLASPSAAAILAGVMWVSAEAGWVGDALPFSMSIAVCVITVLAGLLMISNVQYYSFKSLSLKDRVPFVVVLLIVIVIAVITINPSGILLLSFSLYVASGPVYALKRKFFSSAK
ncbi:Uncharacterised protein [BD1-7 clade bacterium]|uniref:CDP-diacylglycerol--serine O-phosphatidyltransferase n=1 Tax=BD1-7 clade bacterium TaxID=2029982 RepID=A0A5S9PY83_9GAMM|nr:Uncharacterised protein [BD1-7 clade bacterium]CAA0109429.1 Uncharacterised protein [BD1-7 clade bacterium]